MVRRSSSVRSPSVTMALTSGWPVVMVPVLSNIHNVNRATFSSVSPVLMSIPRFAPTPIPTMTAVGVASPKAQGQAMTSTEMKLLIAHCHASPEPMSNHMTKARVAMIRTKGTKIAATRSASVYGGFRSLGTLHGGNDLGQGRIFTDACRLEGEGARLVDRTTVHLIAWSFADGEAFPREERFVDDRLSEKNHPIGGDTLSWPAKDPIPHLDFRYGYLLLS